MTKSMSLHIGLNSVDPAQYEGWDGQLAACEADAKDMRALAKKQKFDSSKMLLTAAATAQAVTDGIADAAKKLEKGDLFFLTYSGHGGQVRDTNSEEKDRWDETWVCYDRQFVDDELYDLWQTFKPGVRILVLSDSCHSGTAIRDIPAFLTGGARVRAMPTVVVKKVQKAHAKLYKQIQDSHPAGENVKPKASVLLLSGCQDNQLSRDGERNGLFTGTLRKIWKDGAFDGSYRKFCDAIIKAMPKEMNQTPNYYFIGARNAQFQAQKPFTV